MALRDVKTFWGGALAIAAAAATSIPGVIAGTVTAASGGKFQDGVDSVMDPVMNAASQFGDDHGDKLTGAAITIVGSMVSNEINQQHNKTHHPPTPPKRS